MISGESKTVFKGPKSIFRRSKGIFRHSKGIFRQSKIVFRRLKESFNQSKIRSRHPKERDPRPSGSSEPEFPSSTAPHGPPTSTQRVSVEVIQANPLCPCGVGGSRMIRLRPTENSAQRTPNGVPSYSPRLPRNEATLGISPPITKIPTWVSSKEHARCNHLRGWALRIDGSQGRPPPSANLGLYYSTALRYLTKAKQNCPLQSSLTAFNRIARGWPIRCSVAEISVGFGLPLISLRAIPLDATQVPRIGPPL